MKRTENSGPPIEDPEKISALSVTMSAYGIHNQDTSLHSMECFSTVKNLVAREARRKIVTISRGSRKYHCSKGVNDPSLHSMKECVRSVHN